MGAGPGADARPDRAMGGGQGPGPGPQAGGVCGDRAELLSGFRRQVEKLGRSNG